MRPIRLATAFRTSTSLLTYPVAPSTFGNWTAPGLTLSNAAQIANAFKWSPRSNLAAPTRAFATSSIASMGSDSSKPGGQDLPKGKSQDQWRAVLSPAQFKVLREGGTEPGFTHEFNDYKKDGVYTCAACDTPLYKSTTKFSSGCGWPAFFDGIPGAIKRYEDVSWGMKRVEIRCAACDSHLGHVFEGEGFGNPTDERHCVNGISLTFHDEKDKTGKI